MSTKEKRCHGKWSFRLSAHYCWSKKRDIGYQVQNTPENHYLPISTQHEYIAGISFSQTVTNFIRVTISNEFHKNV